MLVATAAMCGAPMSIFSTRAVTRSVSSRFVAAGVSMFTRNMGFSDFGKRLCPMTEKAQREHEQHESGHQSDNGVEGRIRRLLVPYEHAFNFCRIQFPFPFASSEDHAGEEEHNGQCHQQDASTQVTTAMAAPDEVSRTAWRNMSSITPDQENGASQHRNGELPRAPMAAPVRVLRSGASARCSPPRLCCRPQGFPVQRSSRQWRAS